AIYNKNIDSPSKPVLEEQHETTAKNAGSVKRGHYIGFTDEEKVTFSKRFHDFFSIRYNILSIFFAAFGLLVFISTAILQLSPASDLVTEAITSGASREQVIKAPRGNIFDRYGIPLAVSENINVLYLCEAGLDNDSLNAMLLDLALYFEKNDVSFADTLSDYLQVSPFRFVLPEQETAVWQTSRNTFNLAEPPAGKLIDFTDKKYVKTDPEVFFNFLRYTLFDISSSYTAEDAFRIMRFRYAIYIDRWNFSNGKPLEIARNVDDSIIKILEEQNYRFTGILSGVESERRYLPDAKYLGHVIGYLGAVSSSEFDTLKDAGYNINDSVGKSGVEQFAERYLHGADGVRPYNILTARGDDETFFADTAGKAPISGNDIMLTIDLHLQKIALDSLEKNIDFIKKNPKDKNKGDADSGAVVMIDVKTGETLVMASYPSFDPNDFMMAQYDEASMDRMVDALTNKKDKPMLNRAIMEIYAPGSTFKPITAVSALETGVDTNISCHGTEMIAEWKFRCLEYPARGHGDLSLTRGIATSCNIYFHKLGVATGINNMDKWMKLFGLGEYSGIDLPGEEKGYRSNRETKKLLRQSIYDQTWFPADTAQTAIGQFDSKYTVLQLARYAAALSNGLLVTPHVIKEVTRYDGTILLEGGRDPIKLPVKASTLAAVKKGMIAVSKDREGTARRVFNDFPITIACKTGTAETGNEDRSSSNALFICYAPADNPQVAIAQIVEKGVWGSNTMGIAKDLLTAYFGLDDKVAYETVLVDSLD
ncbi:MAG: penicillin-binding transpeptidase domain-containing protein, partial [Saccharofermentanales bacterium]